MTREDPRAALALGLLVGALVAPVTATQRPEAQFHALHTAAASTEDAPIIQDLTRAARKARTMGKKEGYRYLAIQVEKAATHHRADIPPAFYLGLDAVLEYAARQAEGGSFFSPGHGKARDALVLAASFSAEHAEGLLAGGWETFRKVIWMTQTLLPEYGPDQSTWMIQAMATRLADRDDLGANRFNRGLLRALARAVELSDDKYFHFCLKGPYNLVGALELDAGSFSQAVYISEARMMPDSLAARYMRTMLDFLPEPPHAWGGEAIEGFRLASDGQGDGGLRRREQVFALLQYLHYGEAGFVDFCALPLQTPFEQGHFVFPVDRLPALFGALEPQRIPEEYRDDVATYVATGNGVALRSLAVKVAVDPRPCATRRLPWGYYYR